MAAHNLVISLLILASLILSGGLPAAPAPEGITEAPLECRFGVDVASWGNLDTPNKTVASYDLPSLGTGYYLDWRRFRNPTVPNFIGYVNILSVQDINYQSAILNTEGWAANNLGAVWIIGNEPDDATGQQDDVDPVIYAERFFELAKILRVTDPTARIGFGNIIMATPLRILYLQRAWHHLVQLTKNTAYTASGLIDIWTPHNFVLSEEVLVGGRVGAWGPGIPLGMEDQVALAEPLEFSQMGDLNLFKERMLRYRQFMKDIGEQNKPLWLTEWGILAPSQQPPGSTTTYFTIPESVTAQYFVDTVNWMETTADPAQGMPADGDRLFQKWFWYSLNDPLYHFGGTLVNPLTLKPTYVGSIFTNYEPPAGSEPVLEPDLEPIAIGTVTPLARHGSDRSLVDYRVEVRVRNHVIHNHLTDGVVSLYDESNTLLGSGTLKTNRCGGDGFGAVFGITLSPGGTYTLRAVVSPAAGADTNPGNDEATFQVSPQGLPQEVFAPLIRK